MAVLEVGPGSGTYTMGAARRIGAQGRLVTVDIEPKMIERVRRRAEAEGIGNIEARVANVYDLPFEDGTFDVVYMIAVIGDIPNLSGRCRNSIACSCRRGRWSSVACTGSRLSVGKNTRSHGEVGWVPAEDKDRGLLLLYTDI